MQLFKLQIYYALVMVGQHVMLEWLAKLAPIQTQFGYETANLRSHLGLVKTKDKAAQTPESHAVDGLALAASEFIQYGSFHTANARGHQWSDSVQLTPSVFRVAQYGFQGDGAKVAFGGV